MTILAAMPAFANPALEPLRVVNGQTVQLTPLFKWWAKREGPRPLAAWVHVTGNIVGTNSLGWVVEAKLEKTERPMKEHEDGQSQILLRNPPLQQRAEFENLHHQMTQLTQQRANLLTQENRAKNQADVLSKEQKGHRHSRAVAAEQKEAASVASESKQQLQPLDKQIQELKKKLSVFPNPDHYEVDCFALDTAQVYQHFPVFDHGQTYH